MAREEPKLLVVELLNALGIGLQNVARSPAFQRFMELEYAIRQLSQKGESEVNIVHKLNMSDVDVKELAAAVAWQMETQRAGKKEPFIQREVYVKPDGVVHIQGFDEPLDLITLRRTLGNLASSLLKVREWAQRPEGEADIRRSTALNYLARAHRSIEMLAILLKSSEVSSVFSDALVEDEEITGRSREGLERLVHEDPDNPELKLAEVYRRLKRLRDDGIPPELYESLNRIMLYISNGGQHG